MLRLALAIALLAAPAGAMTFEVRGTAVWATGSIEDGDAGRFARALTAGTNTVVIDSLGGKIIDADLMAANIRVHRLGVVVVNHCDSACFLMFLAGQPRSVVRRATVGVHSVNVDGDESAQAMISTIYTARRAASLGATYVTIGKLVTTPPDGISYLTDADLAGLGVRFVAAP